ncbi:MAG: dethiobiotin synthase [Gammaproteobacteria bacterium]|nr:dethiobiotin synthase [Gammaproteobacteria bacterium]MDH5691626.1 dethiobiotin synthase [Gammaproteobacteria bacterium]
MKDRSAARYLITGTDTGVGKTVATISLGKALQQQGLTVSAMKPVASGCEYREGQYRNEDALLIQKHLCPQLSYEDINPYAFAPAIAPHIAAQFLQQEIKLDQVCRQIEKLSASSDVVLVEGAGGLKVPLNKSGDDFTTLAKAAALSTILVVDIRIGCINHSLLTVESITQSGLEFAGWIANLNTPHTKVIRQQLNTLQKSISAPLFGIIPLEQNLDFVVTHSYLNTCLL